MTRTTSSPQSNATTRLRSSFSSTGAASISARRTRRAGPRSRSRATRATSPWPSFSLEVSPQRVEGRERRERRGLRAQHARPEARSYESCALQRALLVGREAGFRPGGDRRRALQFDLPDRVALSGQEQCCPAALRPILVEVDERQYLWNIVAAALLASRNRNSFPV